MNKAVFFDIDGTLIDCMKHQFEPSFEVLDALKRLKNNKDYIFIATGRPYAFLTEEIKKIPFDGIIISNGSQVIMNKHAIYESPMNPDELKKLVSSLEELNIEYIVESYPYSYIKKEYEQLYNFYQSIKIPTTLVKREDVELNIPVYKIEALSANSSSTKKLKLLLENHLHFDYFCSIDETAIEIFAKNNTKAIGIQKVLEYLNIDKENSFAFGDGINDIEMLQFVGTGIAMGNASTEVKKYADIVTDSVSNHGVATGILKHVI